MDFKFGDRVKVVGRRDVFLVLGTEAGGKVQIATLNWKTAAFARELERA